MVLQPQNSFTVVRQIANHLDTGTYYVRAVIRNAYTDALIKNLDLTDKGSQRFSKNWQVSADPSGQGFYISIITSVYTDSEYTTKSENYGDEENTYLVQDRIGNLTKGGGGLDTRTTRRIFAEELAKVKFPKQTQKEIKITKTDLTPVIKGIDILKKAIFAIKPVNLDLKPVTKKLDKISKEIEKKPVTPETDLSDVLNVIKRLESNITKDMRLKIIQAMKESILSQNKELEVDKIKSNFNIKNLAK